MLRFLVGIIFILQCIVALESEQTKITNGELRTALNKLTSKQQDDMIIALVQAVAGSLAIKDSEIVGSEEEIQELAINNPEALGERVRAHGEKYRQEATVDTLLENEHFQLALMETRLQQRALANLDQHLEARRLTAEQRRELIIFDLLGMGLMVVDVLFIAGVHKLEPVVGKKVDSIYESLKQTRRKRKGTTPTSNALGRPQVAFN